MLNRCFYLYKSIICMDVMKNLYLVYHVWKFICCLLFHKSLKKVFFCISTVSFMYSLCNVYVIYLINIYCHFLKISYHDVL